MKGTTGTQASFLALFDGDHAQGRGELDRDGAPRRSGSTRPTRSPGQTYSRKVDSRSLAALGGVAESATGSARTSGCWPTSARSRSRSRPSRSARRRWPTSATRCGPSGCARWPGSSMGLPPPRPQTAATQWLERTLDDSANRRLAHPPGVPGGRRDPDPLPQRRRRAWSSTRAVIAAPRRRASCRSWRPRPARWRRAGGRRPAGAPREHSPAQSRRRRRGEQGRRQRPAGAARRPTPASGRTRRPRCGLRSTRRATPAARPPGRRVPGRVPRCRPGPRPTVAAEPKPQRCGCDQTLTQSALPLPLLRRGKVREVYEVDPEHLLLVASDRVSAFDVVMNEAIPTRAPS